MIGKTRPIKFLIVFIIFFVTVTYSQSLMVFADSTAPQTPPVTPQSCTNNTFLGFPTWYQYLPLDNDCNIYLTDQNYIPIKIAMGIFDIILYLAGIVATIMVFYGGFKYLTSNGDSSKIANGKNTLVNALIGLAIAIIASQVVGFVAGRLS